VEQLDRISIGKLVIPATLAPGQWQWLDDAELVSLGWVPPAVAEKWLPLEKLSVQEERIGGKVPCL